MRERNKVRERNREREREIPLMIIRKKPPSHYLISRDEVKYF